MILVGALVGFGVDGAVPDPGMHGLAGQPAQHRRQGLVTGGYSDALVEVDVLHDPRLAVTVLHGTQA